jgi:protein-disulfide isomerase
MNDANDGNPHGGAPPPIRSVPEAPPPEAWPTPAQPQFVAPAPPAASRQTYLILAMVLAIVAAAAGYLVVARGGSAARSSTVDATPSTSLSAAAAETPPPVDRATAAPAEEQGVEGAAGRMGPPVLPGTIGTSGSPPAEEPTLFPGGVPGTPPAAFPAAPPTGEPLFDVPLGISPAAGASEPLAVLIVFTDFQCPYCARVAPVLDQLLERHGADLRVVFKSNPLPMHSNAALAAQAAAAAQAQGRFWQYHDLLFANTEQLARPDLERYAREAGLDEGVFRAALDGELYKPQVDADVEVARRFGINATPTFVLNGRVFSGALPYEKFEEKVAAAITEGRALLEQGVPRGRIYASLVRDGLAAAAPPAPRPAPAAQAPQPPPEMADVRIDAWNPQLGSGGPVTLVVFTEYLCPFCQRLEETLAALQDAYPGRLHIVYRNFIVHAQAELFARAVLAAHRQGKFRELHKLLFENQAELRTEPEATLDRLAAAAGANVQRLHRDMESAEIREQLEADVAEAKRIGVSGTPTTYINGRRISGARAVADFRAVLDELLGIRGAP